MASGEWRVASEIGVASGTGRVVSSQWSVVSESGGSGGPTQERRPAPEKAPNEAKLKSTQSSLPLEVESSAPEPAGRKRSQFEGDTVPRSPLQAPRLTPTVASESGGSGERRVASGSCAESEPKRGEPTPEVSQGQVVGLDSNLVIDDSTNDKIGILSHEGTDAADRPCQGACVRQSLPGGLKTPEKAPNEAQMESTQDSFSLEVKLSDPGPEGRKRSRFAADGAVPNDLATIRATRSRRHARAKRGLGQQKR